MKDLINQHEDSEAIYKDAVIIGNGPSGLALSYILSGNWPYYNGNQHPDSMLTTRLSTAEGRPLIQTDLKFLALGLEGRSNNPMSLLMDSLCHPGADMGLDLPSLVNWRHHPDKKVDHIVLGKGTPGGAWQDVLVHTCPFSDSGALIVLKSRTMDPNVLTISLNSWMELPGLPWQEWEGKKHSAPRRVTVAAVANYYRHYVNATRIARFTRNGAIVTNVRPLHDLQASGDMTAPLWQVEGYDMATNKEFVYKCGRVIMATGSTDIPNRLGVPGELSYPRWVFHNLAHLEDALDSLAAQNPDIRNGVRMVDPLLIVGAGLSAADAVLSARFRSIPVIHVFNRTSITPDKMLPEIMYPEYHKVQQMMTDQNSSYPDYTALAGARVSELSEKCGRKVKITMPDGLLVSYTLCLAAVLIGSRPDLSFLPDYLTDPNTLGVLPNKAINCRSNPIAVDPWTNMCQTAPEGLYALGPLAGDNFVRFICGGAMAITAHIHQQHKKKNKQR